MEIEKYTPNSLSVGAILGLIASGDIAISEIQRLSFGRKRKYVTYWILSTRGIQQVISSSGKIQMFD